MKPFAYAIAALSLALAYPSAEQQPQPAQPQAAPAAQDPARAGGAGGRRGQPPPEPAAVQPTSPLLTKFVPVTDEMLLKPDPANWLMWRRTLDSWGYSPLNQVNRSNVNRLRLVWTRGLGPGVQEGTPLVYNGILFMPNPSDYLQAMDATTGELLWDYRRPNPEDIPKYFPAPTGNRNVAIYGDKIIDTSQDDYLYAIDAVKGTLAWQTMIADYKTLSAQHTSGPITANGKVFSGRGCEPRGAADACVITAHDARTGKELWRTRTIPRPGEPGAETWGDTPLELRRHVGTWMVPSYDPELNLVYIGTSVTSPAPKFQLGGIDKKHLYHNCTLALDANTGKIVWFYQHLVDHWDIDHPYERILVDTVVAPNASEVSWINPRVKPGERRKVMTGIPGKTGIVYTLDRTTGEFLWARPTVMQTLVSKIDGATGEVTVNPDAIYTKAGDFRRICPTSQGGKNWPAGAYSPTNNVMFMPLQNSCAEVAPIGDTVVPNSLYGTTSRGRGAPDPTRAGTVYAISVENGRTLWKFEQAATTYSLVATGGGLVFGGDIAGKFRAFDQTSGKVLWEINLNSPVTGYPVTYSVNGKQYVVASTGGGLQGGRGRGGAQNSAIFVFALPD